MFGVTNLILLYYDLTNTESSNHVNFSKVRELCVRYQFTFIL